MRTFERHARRTLIIGGGIGGLAAALFLERIGVEALVFEAHEAPALSGAALTIAPNGMTVLAHLGLAEAALAAGSPIERFKFATAAGRSLGSMAYAPAGRYPYPGVSLNRATLYDLLLVALRQRGISVAFGKSLVSFVEGADGVTARFADGDEARGDFLVGADGLHSLVRDVVVPEVPLPQFTGLISAGGFTPRSVMLDVLRSEGPTTMGFCFGSAGFFGYALGDNCEKNGAYWWNAQARDHAMTDAEKDRSYGEDGAQGFLRADASWSPTVRRLVEATTSHIAPMNLFDVGRLSRWSSARAVLIGDAAHAVSPHSGQGASMALEDAHVLADSLARGVGLAAAFTTYESIRRSRAERVVEMGRRNGAQKQHGRVAHALQMLLMPIFLKMAPSQRWLYGYDAGSLVTAEHGEPSVMDTGASGT